jgi:hypothetical protein
MAKPKQPTGSLPTARAAPGKPASGEAAPGTTAPGQTTPGKPASGQVRSGKTAPGQGGAAKGGAAKGGAAKGGAARRAGGRPAARGPAPRVAPMPPPLVSVAEPAPLPRTVQVAVWLMYAGAILSALDLIATLTTVGSARSELHKAHPNWTAAQLTTSVHSLVIGFVVSWLITIGLWLIMARTNRAGRGWARNAATVLSVFSTLSFFLYLREPGSLLGKLLLAPMWLVGVAAAVLLWRRESTTYIKSGGA